MKTKSNDQAWIAESSRRLRTMKIRSGETPLLALQLPRYRAAGIEIYVKDESAHPTGSLKHRLSADLFGDALCNGKLRPGRPVIEASSGSTAVSEAQFAMALGLRYYAVMPQNTSEEKVSLIRHFGGVCAFVDHPQDLEPRALEIADETGGHFMDQFKNAERVTDWRGNNIAHSILAQMAEETHPIPAWIVCGAGTGGTSATIGRHLRYRGVATRVCVADPEGSAFRPYWESRNPAITTTGSNIEGIGRPRVESSFIPSVIDETVVVTDAQSLGAMLTLSTLLARKVGPSSGTNFFATIQLAEQMLETGTQGSLVTVVCDSGDRYLRTYHNESWAEHRFGPGHKAARSDLENQMGDSSSKTLEVA